MNEWKKTGKEEIVANKNMVSRWYHILSHSLLTRYYVRRIRQRFELLLPGQENLIQKKTLFTAIFGIMIVVIECSVVFLLHPSVFQGVLAITLAVVLHHELITVLVRSIEYRLLMQFEQFVTDVRHYYYSSHMVDEAILNAMESVPIELRNHVEQFYEIVTSESGEDLALQYQATVPNNFFHLFLALCTTVIEYGDRQIGDHSLFQFNLSNLKLEINIELLRIKQVNYIFSGLIFVSLVPITLMKVIEQWALSNLSELSSFYHGVIGYITVMVIAVLTMITYMVINELREFQVFRPQNETWIHMLLMKPWIRKRIQYLKEHEYQMAMKAQKRIEQSNDTIELDELLLRKLLYLVAGFIGAILFSISSCVKRRTYYTWYELLFACIIGICAYKIPDIRLMFHRKMREMGKEDEIIRYQSIVLMLMYMERVTVAELLERVEEFARIYRKQLQNCINNFNYSETQALEELKYSDSHKGFRRFVDQLLIADEIGIEKAFDEVAADRQYFHEKRKQENQISLDKRGALAKFIAYLPAIAVIGGYLILPFLIECYRQLSLYTRSMSTFLN